MSETNTQRIAADLLHQSFSMPSVSSKDARIFLDAVRAFGLAEAERLATEFGWDCAAARHLLQEAIST